MKSTCTLLLLIFSCFKCLALTSDTIHVKQYDVNIDSINFTNQTITGRTVLTIQSKLHGVNNISLSLLTLTIDSITSGNQQLTYTYNDTVIHITTPATLNQNDTIVLTIAYHGLAHTDSTWGGFYFTGNFAFNMGVGLYTNPHPYGRAWFPCIDEFTDKAMFQFHITTDSGYKAFSNGILNSSIVNSNGTTTWNWHPEHPIPSYLASVAVAPFYTIYRNYQGIPVEIACLPGDSAHTITTFQHLDSCLMFYNYFYGAYPWDKAGFICVPFNYGAMEHATSIHIGSGFIDGTLTWETLWAHELSHQWWGDKVTCASEQDMWLNEGFAVSNEHLFDELFYGEQAYANAIRSNHLLALQFSHVIDGGYYAINAVPHGYTYGETVYKKGPDLVHTLRKYMGDTAYFAGCKGYLDNLAYQNAASADLRDQLDSATGIDLTTFFNDWIFTPGFPHFSVDSFSVTPSGGSYDVTVHTRQKQKGNTHIYTMPVPCTFSDGVHDTTVTMLINAQLNEFNFTFPFYPVRTTIDKNADMASAIVADEQSLSHTGTFTFTETNSTVKVINVGADSSTVRIEHNFVPPDPFRINQGIRISDYHYYRVDGIFQNGFLAQATFQYNGSTSLTTGYLDNTLITGIEDSLVLLYRAGTADDWQVVNGFVLNTLGSDINKIGTLTTDTLKKGEYAFGYRDFNVAVQPIQKTDSFRFNVSPNPVADICTINFQLPYGKNGRIEIYDESCRMVFSNQVFSNQDFIKWDTYRCKAGIYMATLFSEDKRLSSTNIIVVR